MTISNWVSICCMTFVFGASLGGLVTQWVYRVRAPKLVRKDELGQRVTKVGQAWGMLDPEDLPTHFLDTFLLRYFWYGLRGGPFVRSDGNFDWEMLILANPQLKPAPELFHQLTGHKLSLMQLDWCAAQFFERQAKQVRSGNPDPLCVGPVFVSANAVNPQPKDILQESANIKTA